MRSALLRALTALLLLHGWRSGQATSMQNGALEFSCSVFPASTSEADLIARYGAENVVTAPVFGFDDGPSEGTVLFPDSADARLQIIWLDPESKRRPAWIFVRGENSRWRTPNGITLGNDLLMLEKANRRPFRLNGFAREGSSSGMVLSWAGGFLETPSSEVCTLMIHMFPRPRPDVPMEVSRQVARGADYSSGHPAMQELNPRVVSFTITYPRR